MSGARESALNPGLALAACVLVGAACARLRLPLPWMIGPLVAMAAANFAGAGLRAPRVARPVGQLVIGCALGLYFTPAVAREVLAYWPLLLAAGALAIALGALSAWLLARIARTDSRTAFFASVPGGATEMLVLGERFGARLDRVALAQSLRVLVVVIAVPFALTYSGVHGTDLYQPLAVAFQPVGLAILLAAAVGAAAALQAMRLPNAFMFGPLAAAAALTVADLQLSSMPAVLSNAAQVLIGCALGARFERRSLESAPRFVFAVLASVLVAIAVAAGFATGLGWASGVPIATLILATAPGGIAEMCITAKVLQLGVPLVTAAHVARVVLVVSSTAACFRAARAIAAHVRSRKPLSG